MPHHTPLIGTIVVGLVLAFVFGALAQRLRISPLVGYLMAGVAVGPFTPGFVADQGLANELAEIGVILLMFGVGLHFSLKDLLSVRAIAIPGALVQILVATLLGIAMTWAMGWTLGAGIVFGLALSVASTVVLIRALQERRLMETERGRIAVGWLIVEDLAMVLALVMLPAVAGLLDDRAADASASSTRDLLTVLGITLGKVALFVALMLVVGRRVIPWVLHYIVHTGSRELFRLCVLAIALGVAYGAAQLFDVSFALGAFFAGMVLSESELSQRAAEETLPLRDAFAVLFFVSVGMLFDPSLLISDPLPVLGTFLIIVFGKSLAAFLIVIAFRHPAGTALTIAASLAQIGEFSFILAVLGVQLDLLPEQGRDLIVTGAILSILTNPLFFIANERLKPWLERRRGQPAADIPPAAPEEALVTTALSGHVVVVGYGRVGGRVALGLKATGTPTLVVEESHDLTLQARADGFEAIEGNAVQDEVLVASGAAQARAIYVAIPNAFEAALICERARQLQPALDIVARAHSDAEIEHLRDHGASLVIMGEQEIARGMLDHAIGRREGVSLDQPGLQPGTA